MAIAERRTSLIRGLLAALLGFAGIMHAVLTPQHFGESTLMGIGFAAAAVAELSLAVAVLAIPQWWPFAATIVVATGLIGMYAWNVLIGLPFAGVAASSNGHDGHTDTQHQEPGHHEEMPAHEGLVIGSGEPIDAAGAATKGAELGIVAIAAWLLVRERRPRTAPTGRGEA